ncbi:hypothetical protein [Streptomyces fuscichromogenes]|nr:hypothetical protein [Streptomyces fuscichromogenes]
MTIRAARGGTAVRWAYGVFLTLCVALAVLVHHETPATDVSAMPGAVHTPSVRSDRAAPSGAGVSPLHDIGDATCACACVMPGSQHCGAASVESVRLAAPGPVAFDPLARLRPSVAGRVPGATAIGRAPPDLSVLSQLRI